MLGKRCEVKRETERERESKEENNTGFFPQKLF